jgi:DNA repair protein RadC
MKYRLKLSEKELLKELLHVLRVKGDIDAISESAINEFGTFRDTLAQGSDDLKKIKAFTPTVIRRLKTTYSLFREIIKPEDYLTDAQTYEGLSYFMHTAPKYNGECLRILFLDENHTILKDFIYKKGSGNHVKFYFREIVREVLRVGITNLVIIHHKLGASQGPSTTDRNRFKEFHTGFKALDINLVDFLIISQKSLFSFKNSKLFPSHA